MRRNISNSDAECYHPSVIINHGSSSSHGTSGNGKQSAYTQTNETASTQTDETASTQTDKKSRSLCGRRSRVD
jgi:hypothetical protein